MTASQPGAVRSVPEHLHTVTPRLVVADGAAAIGFYATAFGAEEVGDRFTGPDGEPRGSTPARAPTTCSGRSTC
jgi:hypothetical protein